MKVYLYDGDMNINREYATKYVEIQKKMNFRNQKGENLVLVQMFYNPIDTVLNAPPIFPISIEIH